MNMQVAQTSFTSDTLDKIRTYVCEKYPEVDGFSSDLSRFMDAVVEFGLDPRRGHLYPHFSFPKNGARLMEPTTTNMGMRVKAERTGIYLPGDDAPIVETSEDAKDSRNNPHGIVKATVFVKKFTQGEWHVIPGVAFWNDFLHLAHKTNWQRQPFAMIIARAEAQALRRAFPDLLSIYTKDEMEDFEADRDATITREPFHDDTPVVQPKRLEKPKPKADSFVDWMDEKGLVPIRMEDFGNEAEKWLTATADDPDKIIRWRDDRVNAELRKAWWAKNSKTPQAKRIVALLSAAVDRVNERKKKMPANA